MSFVVYGGVGQPSAAIAYITAGLTVWYRFEDTTTTDSSGNGYTGTLGGSPVPTLGTGKLGQGMAFNGGSGQVAVSPTAMSLSAASSPFSIMAWIATTQTNACIFGGRNSGSGNPIIDLVIGNDGLGNAGTGKPSILLRDTNGNGLIECIGTGVVNDGAFHHIAVTYNGSNALILYVDGTAQTTVAPALTTGISFDTPGCNVGYEQANAAIPAMIGTIDDFRRYSSALSAAQIASIASGNG